MYQRLFLSALAALALAAAGTAQQWPPQLRWGYTYGTEYTGSYCYQIQQTSDGGLMLAGDVVNGGYDFFLVKTDANGNQLWNSAIGGAGEECCNSAMQTADGGYALAGYWAPYYSGPGDFLLVKTDSDGDSLWTRTYHWNSETCESVLQAPDGGYLLAGWAWDSSFPSQSDGWLIRTNTDGDSLWARRYGGSDDEFIYSISPTTDGGYVLTGSTKSYPPGNRQFWLVKTNAVGDTLWTRAYGDSNEEWCFAAKQTTDGGYILAGNSRLNPQSQAHPLMIKTDEDGDSLWSSSIGGMGTYCFDLVETWDHRYVMAGLAAPNYTDDDMWLAKVDNDGDSLWSVTFGGAPQEKCYSFCQTSDSGFALAGYYLHVGPVPGDFCLMKTGPDYVGITMDLAPHTLPVSIPPGGGSFQFDAEIRSNCDSLPRVIDAWIVMTLPSGVPYPIMTRKNLNLPMGGSLIRQNLTQFIPGSALPGIYHYVGYVRDHSTFEVCAADSFVFLKLSGGDDTALEGGWQLLGWEDEESPQVAVPAKFELALPSPNPFNPSTAISFQLSADSHIKLEVFDISGRLVATLVDGWRETGTNEVVFNGSGLPSGIYFIQLMAGDFSTVKKINLMK